MRIEVGNCVLTAIDVINVFCTFFNQVTFFTFFNVFYFHLNVYYIYAYGSEFRVDSSAMVLAVFT